MAFTWTTVAFPPAIIGVPYEAGAGFSGSVAMSAFAVQSGNLPTGLTVSSTTDSRIIGTPTALGTFTFTLTGGGVTSGSYTITVYGTEGDFEKVGVSDTPAAAAVQMWPLGNY
jgi:large repetitive protein